jgi:hypothetical protein
MITQTFFTNETHGRRKQWVVTANDSDLGYKCYEMRYGKVTDKFEYFSQSQIKSCLTPIKTLIVHPRDVTTNVFYKAYRFLNCDILRDSNIGKLNKLIAENDRIVFLGHGNRYGLYKTPINGLLLFSDKHVDLVKDKECIYIWCYADDFTRRNNLSGFCTGMVISDFEEANDYCINASLAEIEASNINFANALSKVIVAKNTEMEDTFKQYFEVKNAVDKFNLNSVFYRYV